MTSILCLIVAVEVILYLSFFVYEDDFVDAALDLLLMNGILMIVASIFLAAIGLTLLIT